MSSTFDSFCCSNHDSRRDLQQQQQQQRQQPQQPHQTTCSSLLCTPVGSRPTSSGQPKHVNVLPPPVKPYYETTLYHTVHVDDNAVGLLPDLDENEENQEPMVNNNNSNSSSSSSSSSSSNDNNARFRFRPRRLAPRPVALPVALEQVSIMLPSKSTTVTWHV